MPPRKTNKPSKKDEGLARTDNNLKNHSWPVVYPINQKNFYTDYLKRDDQALVWRQRSEAPRSEKEIKDRGLIIDGEPEKEGVGGDGKEDEEHPGVWGSRVIIIHPGSRNLRIGRASDALPKTIPNVIARQHAQSEWEEDPHPRPKRLRTEDESKDDPEDIGDNTPQRRTRGSSRKSTSLAEREPSYVESSFQVVFNEISQELKIQMRQNKRRVLPNSREGVINHNKKYIPESIKEHNDPYRAEWTPVDTSLLHFIGHEALHIADNSLPRYKLFWPLRDGVFNEHDYVSKRRWHEDVTVILRESFMRELGIGPGDYEGLSAVLVIPDLYDRIYVTEMLDLLLREFRFAQVCLFQESVAATYGAGFSSACIVDIGAQKTSISCVEEGMVIPDSRLNLKFGGDDVTTTFTQMILTNSFPYSDINLLRRYDYLLAEDLKVKYTTLNEADVVVQFHNFHVRAPGEETIKYGFKTYDEVYLAPFSLFHPAILDITDKLRGRRSLWERSYDLYDDIPNDPVSLAQSSLYRPATATAPTTMNEDIEMTDDTALGVSNRLTSTSLVVPAGGLESTPKTPHGGSPVPEEALDIPEGATQTIIGNSNSKAGGSDPGDSEPEIEALPMLPLDLAIMESIKYAAKGDEKRSKDFFSGILLVGGGSLTAGLNHLLEERLIRQKGNLGNLTISSPPRELDPQVLVWKGASVFGKLTSTNEVWIKQSEYDILNSRVLPYKTLWMW
ncbi:actin-like protein arp8 [Orbilia oligospora]|uniref:Actin-like protein arp8 n=1 Tax=Orbilia oligospora TaxID=2813651 RepID=A0A7C8NIY9_ORBOL|nr:actin-like protein arp8 [Orbilia oligospora]KAF3084874.1 actin-like protein arp8 [Orbilia oligospora]KAF3091608.1 actin-like protein arp8 [Orbilia oligospora]KAF3119508.1 actin-like protein arp8 [Orbilia oligospora]KAF3123063.1 actin-like protein arp8 [Orbilia oligospora]